MYVGSTNETVGFVHGARTRALNLTKTCLFENSAGLACTYWAFSLYCWIRASREAIKESASAQPFGKLLLVCHVISTIHALETLLGMECVTHNVSESEKETAVSTLRSTQLPFLVSGIFLVTIWLETLPLAKASWQSERTDDVGLDNSVGKSTWEFKQRSRVQSSLQ